MLTPFGLLMLLLFVAVGAYGLCPGALTLAFVAAATALVLAYLTFGRDVR